MPLLGDFERIWENLGEFGWKFQSQNVSKLIQKIASLEKIIPFFKKLKTDFQKQFWTRIYPRNWEILTWGGVSENFSLFLASLFEKKKQIFDSEIP